VTVHGLPSFGTRYLHNIYLLTYSLTFLHGQKTDWIFQGKWHFLQQNLTLRYGHWPDTE